MRVRLVCIQLLKVRSLPLLHISPLVSGKEEDEGCPSGPSAAWGCIHHACHGHGCGCAEFRVQLTHISVGHPWKRRVIVEGNGWEAELLEGCASRDERRVVRRHRKRDLIHLREDQQLLVNAAGALARWLVITQLPYQ